MNTGPGQQQPQQDSSTPAPRARTWIEIAKTPGDVNQAAAKKNFSALHYSLQLLNMTLNDYRQRYEQHQQQDLSS
jgi:hypothetical protein